MHREINEMYIEELAKKYIETFNSPPWNDKWTLSLAAKKLDEMINCRGSFGLVCFDNENNMLGMIIGNSDTFYNCTYFFVKDYFIIPSHQGKGIGTALLNELENRLKIKGIGKIYLSTLRKEQTEGFYLKRGYESWNEMVMMGKTIDS